jgi:hypothetical protein
VLLSGDNIAAVDSLYCPSGPSRSLVSLGNL